MSPREDQLNGRIATIISFTIRAATTLPFSFRHQPPKPAPNRPYFAHQQLPVSYGYFSTISLT